MPQLQEACWCVAVMRPDHRPYLRVGAIHSFEQGTDRDMQRYGCSALIISKALPTKRQAERLAAELAAYPIQWLIDAGGIPRRPDGSVIPPPIIFANVREISRA